MQWYRGVRLFAYRASSLSRAAVRMADISLTEAVGVQFYCYHCSLLPSDSGKKRWKWGLASIYSHVVPLQSQTPLKLIDL